MTAFADYATSSAFQINLSKPMIIVLASHMYPSYRNLLYETGQWATVRALMRRGLLEYEGSGRIGSVLGHRRKLTDAGRHVLALCRLAGLLDESLLDHIEDSGFEFETMQKVNA